MRRTSFDDVNCSVARSLEVVGDWWTMLIVRDCLLGVTRFDDFAERLGISRNILTGRLDHLVAHGILRRVPYHERPVRHEYRLTEKGRDLWVALTALRQWGDRWAAPDGAPVVMEHLTCGHAVDMVATCSHCGQPLQRQDLRMRPGPGAQHQPAAGLLEVTRRGSAGP